MKSETIAINKYSVLLTEIIGSDELINNQELCLQQFDFTFTQLESFTLAKLTSVVISTVMDSFVPINYPELEALPDKFGKNDEMPVDFYSLEFRNVMTVALDPSNQGCYQLYLHVYRD